MLAGRNFSDTIAMDDSTTPFPVDKAAEQAFAKRGTNIVINELAAKKRLGFNNPKDAVGKSFKAALRVDNESAWSPGHHHRRRPRQPLPLGPRSRRSR